MNKEIETVILDVDGTLSEDISWLKLTEGLGASPEKHADIFNQMKEGKLTYPEAKRQLIELWQSTGNANKEFMENMFRSWNLKPGANDLIEYLKQSYRVCLMSGAVDLYIQVVADKLSVSDWYANTELIWGDQGSLVDFNYYVDQSSKKLEQLNKYLSESHLDKNKCAVIGDGDSDLALFKELKYSIAVKTQPLPELEQLAFKKVKSLEEIKELL